MIQPWMVLAACGGIAAVAVVAVALAYALEKVARLIDKEGEW